MKPKNTTINHNPAQSADLPTLGQRLRHIRKERGLTQTEFGEILGICKQQLSRYERDERSPKSKMVLNFANSLDMTVGELLGDESATIEASFWKTKNKPFYKIFEDVVYGQLGLSVEEVVVFTGLEENKIRHIVDSRMQVSPLRLALILESSLNVPIDVWAGKCEYTPADISVYGYQLARAYMQLDEHYKAIVSTALYHRNEQALISSIE